LVRRVLVSAIAIYYPKYVYRLVYFQYPIHCFSYYLYLSLYRPLDQSIFLILFKRIYGGHKQFYVRYGLFNIK